MPLSTEFKAGKTAYLTGLSFHACPHAEGTKEQADWFDGWLKAGGFA